MADVLVKELMTPNPITITHNQPVAKALELMRRYEIRRLPVIKDGKLAGVISDRDVRQMAGRPTVKLPKSDQDDAYLQLPVEEVMTLNAITVRESQPAQDAITLMLKHTISGLPVLNRDGALVGVISQQDILKWCLRLLEREADRSAT
jgi:acetoin utilization protein AcuB